MPTIPVIPQGLSPAELKYQRANTRAFIDANPVMVALTPQTLVKTGTGTKYVPGTPRPAQKARIIDQTRTFGPEPGTAVGADGKQRKLEFQLLLEHDGVVGVHDFWLDAEGVRWEVADVLPNQGYEVRAQVMRYGE